MAVDRDRTVMDDDDPYAAAMRAKALSTFTIFGECKVDIWFCVLVKGTGKVPYDPQQHGRDRRCTAINFTIIPLLDEQSVIERGMIAESGEWTRIVRPSLEATGTGLRNVHEKFVAAQLVPSGRKWKDSDGQERDSTTLKFLGVFPDRVSCEQARDEFLKKLRGGEGPVALTEARAVEMGDGPVDSSATVASTTVPPAVSATTVSADLGVALKFLPNLWKASGRDPEKFARLLAKTDLMRRVGIDIEHEDALRVMMEDV